MKQECALGKGGGGAELQKRALVQADEKSRRSTRSASPIRNNRCTTQGTIHQMAMRQSRLNPSEPSHPRPEPARPHFVVVRVVSFCAVCFFFLFVSVLHFVERYAHLGDNIVEVQQTLPREGLFATWSGICTGVGRYPSIRFTAQRYIAISELP